MNDSDSDDENYIKYGNPLEPYEEDELPSKRKYQQPADQFAVDDHGRRRFHGAFTGGFSAGWGNTVGTPEGWTPATFKSSRAEKATTSAQRPEDFMDEEDRSEFGIAPKMIETHSEFSGQKRTRQKRYHDGVIPGEPVLEQVLRPVHETLAVRVLRSMGWRGGRSAGAPQRRKVYGCQPQGDSQPEASPENSDTEFEYETLFAPDDCQAYTLTPKTDHFGIGYSGLSRHSVLGSLCGEYGEESVSTSRLVMRDKGKKVSIRGQAFGVGAFENDDDDIYAMEDMSNYDFTLGGARTEKKQKPKGKQDSSVLEGFTPATLPPPTPRVYQPPALPRGFVPARLSGMATRFDEGGRGRDQAQGRHELSPEARGRLLGEEPPQEKPPPPPQLPTTTEITPTTKQQTTVFTPTTELDYIPIKDSGKEITNIFKPFANDRSKQNRYELYLKDKSKYMSEGDRDMDRLSEWERGREIVEFEQAAKLYRPLTGEMGDRFTHASQPDDALNPLMAVAKSGSDYGLVTPQQVEAAKKGVWGVMTRREQPWRADSLVCKRFNVPVLGGDREEPKKDEKSKVSYSIFSYLETSVHDKESFAKEQTKFSGSKSIASKETSKNTIEISKSKEESPKPSTSVENTGFTKRLTVAELFMKESEKDMQIKDKGVEVADTIEKFDKMDLYKSIFLSDSEDEPIEPPKEFNFDQFLDLPKNVKRNTSPPKGIFANVNFDEINSWRRSETNDKIEAKEGDKNTETDKDGKGEKDLEEVVYGPKIPENILTKIEAQPVVFKPVFRSKNEKETIEIDSSSSDSWVDAKEVKHKKDKKKKDKKHKSKHKKSKHKKKKSR